MMIGIKEIYYLFIMKFFSILTLYYFYPFIIIFVLLIFIIIINYELISKINNNLINNNLINKIIVYLC